VDTILDEIGLVTKVNGSDLLNLLNYVNFRDGTIFAEFRHAKKPEALSFQAFPQPSRGDSLVCRWLAPGVPARVLADYVLRSFVVTDGHSLITVEAEVKELDRETVVFALPEFGSEKSSRKVRRHPSAGVTAVVFQHGLEFGGSLLDFNAVSLQVSLRLPEGGSFHGLNPDSPVTLLLRRSEALLFSGECLITRSEGAGGERTLVLTPAFNNMRRFPPKAIRSVRHTLNPAPSVSVFHPLVGKRIALQTTDLSGVGMGVEEFFENSYLVPGLVLHDIVLEIGNQILLRCSGQVLYRNVFAQGTGSPIVRCGVVFLDLVMEDQARLAALLYQSMNSRFRVCSAVDMEELWRFFFESGFLYPSKYVAIEAYKNEFRALYEKLYLKSSEISRHFLFQDKGTLFAHMSMIRTYPRAWLIHHHAASKSGYGLAGVAVLDQINHYINEFHFHRSSHMDFVMCYYRKENRFPHRVFGGAAEDVANPKGISVDAFAYLHLAEEVAESAAAFQILPASAADLKELKSFYEAVSGGLMLDAMNLTVPSTPHDELDAQYKRLGFQRSHQVFSWKVSGVLKAVVTLQTSDLGLNLSNLTNCLHVVVVDAEGLLPEVLFAGLRQLVQDLARGELPLLVFPKQFLDDHNVPYEKTYLLWVLSMTHSDGCFHSFRNRFKRGSHGQG
jgi:hypothetical protein